MKHGPKLLSIIIKSSEGGNMKKYLYALLVVCLLSVAITGCATPGDEGGGAGDVTKVKLASHNAVIEGNAYRVRYEADIQEAAKAAMDNGLDVSYASFVSNWDPATESQQLENSINEGYDILLVNPVAPTGLDPIIEKALDADIVYINCDCEYYSDKVLNVATDQYYLGYKTATYAGEVLGKGAKVVMIAALDGNAANTDRQAGFEKGIAEQGLEVVGTYNHDWNSVKAQQIMTEILNAGVEFDGVLVSQGTINILAAYDAVGAPWPKFLGFGDDGAYMQRMLEINADETVLPYIVVSNPPGVGASGLNFGLNLLMGKELKEGIYDKPEYNSIYLKSKVWYTDQNQGEFREMAEGMEPGDVISYWLTIDEVAAEYFK
jgi:ribose transport system substrate-binding protein